MPNIIQKIKQRMIDELGKDISQFRGCSASEIREILFAQNVSTLPVVYKSFLEEMGTKSPLLLGSDAYYPQLLNLKRYALELLTEDGNPYELSETIFVFMVHQGYQFMFFDTSGTNADPLVYHYMEGDDKPQQRDFTFSKLLEDDMNRVIDAHKTSRSSKDKI